MAALISPGISVTVIDESMYIPAQSPTVPLFFFATQAEKTVTRASVVSPAAGTFEANKLRALTSFTQAYNLYGMPRFVVDTLGNQLHGDIRNEYGLLAAYKFLQSTGRCYGIRADVDLNDGIDRIRSFFATKVLQSALLVEQLAQVRIDQYNDDNGYYVGHPSYKETVTVTEAADDVNTALTAKLYTTYAFRNVASTFFAQSTIGLPVYSNGYTAAPVAPDYFGVVDALSVFAANGAGAVNPAEFTSTELRDVIIDAAADYQYTTQFRALTSLGTTDAQRRVQVVEAFQASINTNTEIRDESLDYNLILCPGVWEVTDELLALVNSSDISEEAFVIAATPFNLNPEDTVTWATSTVTERRFDRNVAYYYPHGITSNLDGVDVFVPAELGAVNVYGRSDLATEVWFAPAGVVRGSVLEFSKIGYLSGAIGVDAVFTDATLTRGQRDDLYKSGTQINPITVVRASGIVVYGQRTSATIETTLSRVNVSRLMCHVRRQLRRNTIGLLFQPHDQITRETARTIVSGFLGGIMSKRGISDYAVVCDESNNTIDAIVNNSLYIDVALVPITAVEFIYIPLTIRPPGTKALG